MSRAQQAVKDFRAAVAAEFAFLPTEFGFIEEEVQRPANEFSVCFLNPNTRIIVEGINWGGSARVAFGSAGPRERFEDFDLLDLISIRCPDRMPAEGESLPGQLHQLKVLAALLRECGAEVLRGDFSAARQIRDIREQRLDDWKRQEAKRRATLTVSATGRSGERVLSSPSGISVLVGTTARVAFNVGTPITLSVTNGRDAIWSGACSSGGEKRRTCTFTLNADVGVCANVQ
jgi:hypothetical protein